MSFRLCRCGQMLKGREPCHSCGSGRSGQRNNSTARGYDRQWRNLRLRFLAEYPLCQNCIEHDRVRPAVEVHHIKRIVDAPQLRLQWSNLRALCLECHARVHRGRKTRGTNFLSPATGVDSLPTCVTVLSK